MIVEIPSTKGYMAIADADMKPKVLFVNHRQRECGVEQFGSRYYRNLAETKKFETFYVDVDEYDEYASWYNEIKPAAIVWNMYSGATMPWCSREVIDEHRAECKQIGIYHELDISDKNFDLILHQNPFPTDDFPNWALPRSLPLYTPTPFNYEDEPPRFGSFGFGLGGKGFARLVKMVQDEYDHACIHLHIPFAAFGDADGTSARAHAYQARNVVYKPGIQLTIDHQFWPEEQLLEWLAGNTCNAFLYDPHEGRGISGTTDYALAVRRPLAITHSHQFRHVWSVDDSFCVDGDHPKSLHDIIAAGTEPTDKFRSLWSREAFVASFEAALESIGVMP